MYSKMKVAGDFLHHSLIKLQLALYSAVTLLFLAYWLFSNVFWFKMGYIANWGAAAFAVLAIGAYFSWTSKPAEASRIGLRYLGLSLAALIIFSSNLYLQFSQFHNMSPQHEYALGASFIGLLVFITAALTGWNLIEIPADFEEQAAVEAEPEPMPISSPAVNTSVKPAPTYKTPPGLLHS
jgi:uncharacterized membrane protein